MRSSARQSLEGSDRGVIPVTTGSPAYRTVDVGLLRVTVAAFPARQVLAAHAHERTIVGVMLEGGFDVRFRSAQFDCPVGAVWVEPGAEVHTNTLGSEAARPLVLEIDAVAQRHELRQFQAFLDAPIACRHAETLSLARQLRDEVGTADASSSLAIESLSLELLAAASRQTGRDHDAAGSGGWVSVVRELLHDHLDRPLRVADLAGQVGVHRVHLGRVFRARYGQSLGDYHRRLRIEWASRQLLCDEASVSDVALRAGFADQSHFTRFFKRIIGETPASFRAQGRRRRVFWLGAADDSAGPLKHDSLVRQVSVTDG